MSPDFPISAGVGADVTGHALDARQRQRGSNVLTLAILTAGVVHLGWLMTIHPPTADFPLFHQTAVALWSGAPAYPSVEFLPGRHFQNLNPPHFHWAVLPLKDLPVDEARTIWRIVNLACIALAVRMTGLSIRSSWLAAALWSSALVLLIQTGQLAGVAAIPMALLWRSLERERWVFAGVSLGLLILLKVFFGLLLLWLLWERRWRALLGATATGCAVVTGTAVIFGIAPYIDWVEALTRVPLTTAVFNSSWPGLTGRVFSAPYEAWLRYIGAAIAVVVAFQHLRRGDRTTQLLGFSLTALLASPIAWAHYFVILAAPLSVWLARGHRLPAAVWLLWVHPLIIEASPFLLPSWTVPSAYSYGLLAFWFAVLRSNTPSSSAGVGRG